MSDHINPPEPSGIGAILEDLDGCWWVRWCKPSDDRAPWVSGDTFDLNAPFARYGDIDVKLVRSQGRDRP